METTFEDFLKDTFMRVAPEDVGDKDSFDDNFNDWICQLDLDNLIQYGESWGEVVKAQTAQNVTKTITDNFGIVTKGI